MADVLVSVGGSGSKVLESLVFLCAAGLGPEHLRVVCIEPESENGNFRRTEGLLDMYQRLHAFFRSGPDALGTECPLFKTQISTLLPKTLRWSPLDNDADRDLAAVFNKPGMTDASERALFDSLFTFTERQGQPGSEQFTSLSKGFRGRPPMGVAALAKAETSADSSLFSEIRKLVDEAQEQTPPKVFIAGSIFGGTGASQMPALARFIRRYQGVMPIGAAFLLPYFGFRAPEATQLAVKSTEFLRSTRRILSYYASALDEDNVFDSLYVLGAPRLAIVPGNAELGGPGQKNPPLLIELFAAMGACRFLRDGPQNAKSPIHVVRVKDDSIDWLDIPRASNRNNGASAPSTALIGLGSLVRFCWAYSVVYGKELNTDVETLNAQQPWYRNWISSRNVNFRERAAEFDPVRKLLAEFSQSVLNWFATLALPPTGTQGIENALTCHLTDAQSLRSREISEQTGYAAIASLETAQLGDFDRLIHGALPKSMADVLYFLNGKSARGDSHRWGTGLGAFTSALHSACGVEQASV